MSLTTKDLVLQDVELCKQVAPILERLGIEPDYYWIKFAEYKSEDFGLYKEKTYRDHEDDIVIPTYRQDKLALGLPEWCFKFFENYLDIDFELVKYVLEADIDMNTSKLIFCYLNDMHHSRGQPALEATAKLILLLEENNLLEVKDAK